MVTTAEDKDTLTRLLVVMSIMLIELRVDVMAVMYHIFALLGVRLYLLDVTHYNHMNLATKTTMISDEGE